MWRKQKGRERHQFHDKFRDSRRGNYHSHQERDERESFTDRSRENYESYNDTFEDERHLSDLDQIQSDYLDREDERYRDDRDRFDERYQDFHTDFKYREDRLGHDEDYYDTRGLIDTGREDVGTVNYASHIEDDRALYRYDDSRHVVGKDQDWREDQHQYGDNWEAYKSRDPHDDMLRVRSHERDNYRDPDRVDVKNETGSRDDRRFQRDGDRQRHRDGMKSDRRLDIKSDERRSGTRQEKHKSQGKSQHGGSRVRAGNQGFGKNVQGARDRSGTRVEARGGGYNRNKVSGYQKFGNNIKRHEPQKRNGDGKPGEQKCVKVNDEKNITSEKSRSDKLVSRNRNVSRRDKLHSEDQGKHKKGSDEKHTHSTRSFPNKDRNRESDISDKRSDKGSSHSKSRTDADNKLNRRSMSNSSSSAQRGGESKYRKNSRERDSRSRTSRHNSGHSSDLIAESRKLYASVHEDDAISILADDDRFTNETLKYLDHGGHSADKVKTEMRGHTNRSLNDAKFQNISDRSVTVHEVDDAAVERHQEDTIFKTPSTAGYSYNRRSWFKRSTGSKREDSRKKQVRGASVKNAVQSRKPLWKDRGQGRGFGVLKNKSRFENQFERKNSSTGQKRNLRTSDISKMPVNPVSVRIGRTGAVLSEDRDGDKQGRARSLNKNRGNDGNLRDKKGSNRSKDSGITSSNRVKKKYFGKNFRSQGNYKGQSRSGQNSSSNEKKERFNKLRNERDRRDFEKRRTTLIEAPDQGELSSADPGQQLIIFPNPDFQDGQAPFLDQFENTFGNPDLPLGSIQPVPVQFIPSNVAPEVPPGTEYVFIPFVNDQHDGVSDNTFNQNVLNDGKPFNGEMLAQNLQDGPINDRETNASFRNDISNVAEPIPGKKRLLTKAEQNKARLFRLRKERRKALEKRLERRVFARLLRETKETIKAEAAMQRAETRTKPLIKRISPPSATVGSVQLSKEQGSEEYDNMGTGEYDNVSDLEDVSDDENGEMGNNGRNRARTRDQRRSTFRKPGEPRMAMRDRDMQEVSEAWQSADVRKVVERGNPQNISRSPVVGTRPVNTSNTEAAGAERIADITTTKRDRPRTPLQITVSNDQCAIEEATYTDHSVDEFSKNRSEQRRGEMFKEQNSGQFTDRERRQENTYGRYRKNYREDQSRASERWESPCRNRESMEHNERNRGNGKYDAEVRDRSNQRKSRFSDTEQTDIQIKQEQNMGNRNKQLTPNRNQVSNVHQSPGQRSVDNIAGNSMGSPFTDSHLQQNFSVPYSQQPISSAQNQFNVGQSFPLGIQQVGFNQTGLQFNAADPSLPPVSHGSVNLSPYALSGLTMHQDMSMPPTVAASPSMSGLILPQRSISQQNFQAQKPLTQQQHTRHILSDVQHVQSLSQQQQMQMNQKMVRTAQFQTNIGISQQRSPFSSGENVAGNHSHSKESVYQQNQLQLTSQSGNTQHQQQSVVGGIGSGGAYQQKHFQNNQLNSGSVPGMIGQMTVSSNQAFISGHPMTNKDSYNPSTPDEAVQGMKHAHRESHLVFSHGLGPQNFKPRANNPQLFGSVRGTAGLVKVPRASLQMSRFAVGQSGGNQSSDIRANKDAVQQHSGRGDRQFGSGSGAGGSAKGLSQDTFATNDIDDEFGELLCVKCDKVFLSESVMRRHSKWHILVEAGVRELRCDNCEQGFTSSVAFDAHMAEKHRGNSWRCDRCQLTFSNRAAFVRHNQAGHHGGK